MSDISDFAYYSAKSIVDQYERERGIPQSGCILFSDFQPFSEWLEFNGWYEACEGEYDNLESPNSCVRMDLKELYFEFKKIANESTGD